MDVHLTFMAVEHRPHLPSQTAHDVTQLKRRSCEHALIEHVVASSMNTSGGDDVLDGRWQLAAHVRSAEHALYLVCDALPAR
jgi:hypothetical protein